MKIEPKSIQKTQEADSLNNESIVRKKQADRGEIFKDNDFWIKPLSIQDRNLAVLAPDPCGPCNPCTGPCGGNPCGKVCHPCSAPCGGPCHPCGDR